MIDLHTHSLFSDGELIPSELVRRFEALGYRAVAITDHVDCSTLDFVVPRIAQAAKELTESQPVMVVPGVELTHVPPMSIGDLCRKARDLGARLVVVHGETIVEPVPAGTNRAALEAGVDLLAHPGLITPEEVGMAAEKGVFLEISGRKGHSLTNGHVAKLAKEFGARLVIDSDTHSPGDIMGETLARKVAMGAGLSPAFFDELMSNARLLIKRAGYRL
ncbi:MAG: PHP domain-containing protein [Deltaproteobacteria bacterium HGW-Deltaproteobacteria-21]|nr:MAG: PHP domain-containing protein [Deltaproteobacteria bacterium HGW-Deltaproteobacteria-21]